MGRFSEYAQSDLQPLYKLEKVGDEFTDRLEGHHLFESQQDGETRNVLVLDFVSGSWMLGPWHAAKMVDEADPQDGDTVHVRRLPDKGRSKQFSVTVVESDVPVDDGDLPLGKPLPSKSKQARTEETHGSDVEDDDGPLPF